MGAAREVDVDRFVCSRWIGQRQRVFATVDSRGLNRRRACAHWRVPQREIAALEAILHVGSAW
jgi:hypothetical protein